jgi:hypothetical protein
MTLKTSSIAHEKAILPHPITINKYASKSLILREGKDKILKE